MEANEWPYVLTMIGEGQYRFTNATWVKEPVEINRYFLSLRDAFESLLQEELYRFDKYLERPTHDELHFESVVIKFKETDQEIVSVMKISMEDSPEALPPAGLYLNINDDISMRDFEEMTQHNLSQFRSYDPDVPFLAIGCYGYNDYGYHINAEPIWKQLKTVANERAQLQQPDIWRFKLKILEQDIDEAPGIKEHVFHYNEFSAAFLTLMNLDMTKMDRSQCIKNHNQFVSNEIGISDRNDQLLVALRIVKNKKIAPEAAEPGIYIHFPSGMEAVAVLLESAQINPADWNADSQYQKIWHYNETFSKLVPTEAFQQWMPSIQYTSENTRPSDVKYEIEVEWKSVREEFSSEEEDAPSIERQRYASLEEALEALISINTKFFDPSLAVKYNLPTYISAAVIYEDDKPLLTKLNSPEEDSPSLPDIAYLVNMDNINVDLLSALMPHVCQIKHADRGPLIVRLKDNVPISNRKPHQSARMVQDIERKNRI